MSDCYDLRDCSAQCEKCYLDAMGRSWWYRLWWRIRVRLGLLEDLTPDGADTDGEW